MMRKEKSAFSGVIAGGLAINDSGKVEMQLVVQNEMIQLDKRFDFCSPNYGFWQQDRRFQAAFVKDGGGFLRGLRAQEGIAALELKQRKGNQFEIGNAIIAPLMIRLR